MKELRNKLVELGYNVTLRNRPTKWLQCNLPVPENSIEIPIGFGVIVNNDKFGIWNAHSQSPKDNYFNNEKDLIQYVKKNSQ